MARPTDYTPELVEAAKTYLAWYRKEEAPENVASVADLALSLRVSRSAIYVWAKEHPEFMDILEEVLALQEHKLLKNGLNSVWNPTITKLMLSKHGYRESSDITTDGKALPTPILGAATKNETV